MNKKYYFTVYKTNTATLTLPIIFKRDHCLYFTNYIKFYLKSIHFINKSLHYCNLKVKTPVVESFSEGVLSVLKDQVKSYFIVMFEGLSRLLTGLHSRSISLVK